MSATRSARVATSASCANVFSLCVPKIMMSRSSRELHNDWRRLLFGARVLDCMNRYTRRARGHVPTDLGPAKKRQALLYLSPPPPPPPPPPSPPPSPPPASLTTGKRGGGGACLGGFARASGGGRPTQPTHAC